jgi:hypothetical protein
MAYIIFKKNDDSPRTLAKQKKGFVGRRAKAGWGMERDNSRERCRKVGMSEQAQHQWKR